MNTLSVSFLALVEWKGVGYLGTGRHSVRSDLRKRSFSREQHSGSVREDQTGSHPLSAHFYAAQSRVEGADLADAGKGSGQADNAERDQGTQLGDGEPNVSVTDGRG